MPFSVTFSTSDRETPSAMLFTNVEPNAGMYIRPNVSLIGGLAATGTTPSYGSVGAAAFSSAENPWASFACSATTTVPVYHGCHTMYPTTIRPLKNSSSPITVNGLSLALPRCLGVCRPAMETV